MPRNGRFLNLPTRNLIGNTHLGGDEVGGVLDGDDLLGGLLVQLRVKLAGAKGGGVLVTAPMLDSVGGVGRPGEVVLGGRWGRVGAARWGAVLVSVGRRDRVVVVMCVGWGGCSSIGCRCLGAWVQWHQGWWQRHQGCLGAVA